MSRAMNIPVGSVPTELCVPYQSGFTRGLTSRCWPTEQEAMDALVAIGITRFQRADYSWHNA
jgi:hypothetical protein